MTQPTEYQAGIQTLAVWQRPLRGPVTRRRLRRFLTGAAVVAAAAVGLALGAGNGPLQLSESLTGTRFDCAAQRPAS
jgi:hypothetical protein